MAAALRVLLSVAVVFQVTAHVNFLQDEYLWTKATWANFTLRMPEFTYAPAPSAVSQNSTSSLTEKAAQSGILFKKFGLDLGRSLQYHEAISLLGAVPLRGPSETRHGDDILLSPQPWEVLKSNASAGQAAMLVQCTVCKALVREVWRGVVEWLLYAPIPRLSRERLATYIPELCSSEVPPTVLTQFMILESEARRSGGPSHEASNDLVMLERQGETASIYELHAVRLACHMIMRPLDQSKQLPFAAGMRQHHQASQIQSDSGGESLDRRNLFLDAVLDAISSMVKRLEGIAEVGGYQAGGSSGVVVTQDATEGPVLEDTCQDHHLECESWAQQGECSANPRYMTGDGEWPGYCRAACSACQPPLQLRATTLSKRTVRLVVHQATQYSSELEERICEKALPCQHTLDKHLLQSVHQQQPDNTPASGAKPAAEAVRWHSTRLRFVRRISEADTNGMESAADSQIHGVHVLNRHLGGKCLYAAADWWMYELCWNSQLSQFHVAKNQFESFNVIGMRAETSQTPKHHEQQLLPEGELLEGLAGSAVPFANISFTRGSTCVATSGNKVLRSGEVHAACSPDSNHTHLTVVEARRCHYVATLYVPALCGIPGFVPKWVYTIDGHKI